MRSAEHEREGGVRRSGRRNLFENLASLLAAQLVAKSATFVALFFLAREFGEELFGRYAVALAIPVTLEVVADFGVSWAVVREGAGRPAVLRHDVADILSLKAILALLLILLSCATAILLGLPDEVVMATLFLAIARAFDSMTQVARSVFEAFERMEFEAVSFILDATVRLAFTLYALLSGFGLVGLAKALALSGFVVLMASAVLVRHRFLADLPRPRASRWGTLLLAGIPFALLGFFETLGFRVQVILAAVLSGDATAGLFAAAVRVVEATVIFPGMLGTALFPVASRHAAQASSEMGALLLGASKAALSAAIGGGLLLAGIAPLMIPLMFGDDFRPAIGHLQILCLAMPAVFLKLLISRFLLALRSPWSLIIVQVTAVAVMVASGLVLLPRLAGTGAAIALVTGEFTGVIVGLALLRRLPDLWAPAILVPFVPALPAALALALLIGSQPVLAGIVSCVVFAVGVRAARVFTIREVGYLRRAAPWLAPLGLLFSGDGPVEDAADRAR